jgi:hypothetical protein
MLGEMIGEGKGKIGGIRVLPSEGSGARMEVSFQGVGKLLDTHSPRGTQWYGARPSHHQEW